MTAKPKLTDTDVARAYAEHAMTKWASASPRDHFPPECAVMAVTRAISQACFRGVVEHCGFPLRGWLTSAGIALLDEETQEKYRAAVRGRTMMRAG